MKNFRKTCWLFLDQGQLGALISVLGPLFLYRKFANKLGSKCARNPPVFKCRLNF